MSLKAIILIMILASTHAVAIEVPRPSGQDHRIRYVDYHPDEVYQLTAFYGYHVAVVFAAGETVVDTSAGYADAWKVEDYGNYITLSPKELRPETSMFVRTNRRSYSFDLRAKAPAASPAAQARDPQQMYVVRFKYPDDERQAKLLEQTRASLTERIAEQQQKRRELIASLPPKPEHRNYFYQGADAIAPYEVWDDGTFTRMRFYAQQDMPVPFVINEDGTESIVNKHFDAEGVMVIERTADQFVLRKGKSVVCIYNRNAQRMTPRLDTGTTDLGAERSIRGQK